jgi:RNA polymerase sigma-70 factor (ECF subfamily)
VWLAQPATHHDAPTLDPSIAAALQQLSAAQRAVVVCRLLLNLSEQQTATLLRIRPGTVKSRLARAIVLLAGALPHLDPKENQS